MTFRNVFIAVVIAAALIIGAFVVNQSRPAVQTAQPGAQFVKATGKCAECHLQETGAIVHEYELSKHAAVGVTCLDCHAPAQEQTSEDHRGFVISKAVTAANCRGCHATEYEQYARSRHAAPAWAAVAGTADFTPEQIAQGEGFHAGAVNREPNGLARLEGSAAITSGCASCHSVGKPNADGSIGSCTACHSRHAASVEIARTPSTCGSCHMGPDHSQVEIYTESKHGVMFAAQRSKLNLGADPKTLSTRDMFVPTCATCHMSGLDGQRVTHDTTERLSYWLFAEVSDRRPGAGMAQEQMKETCTKCHTRPDIDRFYTEAEAVLEKTNERVKEAQAIMKSLRDDGLLTPEPFDEPIESVYFDLWHYYGRTSKHGAFMGGADFVQWHGNYELVKQTAELKDMAAEIRARHAGAGAGSVGSGLDAGGGAPAGG
ncbi:MAG: nitrate reductase [Phycisphaerales bacterium]|nr:nitrate reductase [Phycisphaerales bacterium]